MPQKIDRKKFLQLTLVSPILAAAKPLERFNTNKKNAKFSDEATYYKKGDPEYDKLRKGFNKRIDKYPALIALCKSTGAVSNAIKYAIDNNLSISVKSGGHCMEGFSSNNDGLMINLSGLKNFEWLDKETIKVGPALTLAELYNNLLPKKRIIPGGSCAGVGIGGLVLGGGYGLMARKFGLTCDSLQSVNMVDGLGNIISSANDSELLWANRGGNNGNFGVATGLVFKTYPAPPTMQSFRFKSYKVSTERTRSILKAWFEVTAMLPTDCFSAFVLNGKTAYILITNVGKYTIQVEQVVNALRKISDKTTRTAALHLAQALKVYYARQQPMYFKNASAGLYKNFAEIENFIDEVIDIVLTTPGMIYQVNTLGGNIQNEAFEKASSFPHRAFTYFSELQSYWDWQKQESRLLERFQQVQQIFIDNKIAAQYRNYPDINFNNWPEMYYGNNYQRLQQLKAKYDPSNLFRYEQSIKAV